MLYYPLRSSQTFGCLPTLLLFTRFYFITQRGRLQAMLTVIHCSLGMARHSLSGYVLGMLAKWSQMSLITLASLTAKPTSRFKIDCSHVTTFALDFLAHPDCCFAATSDDVGQKLIRLSFFCIMLDGMVEML